MSNQTTTPTPGLDSRKLPVVCHYHLLTYPFHHPFHGRESGEIDLLLEKRWEHWWNCPKRSAEPDELSKTLDNSYFFLPHVRELLFPETAFLPARATAQQKPAALELRRAKTPTLMSRLPPESVRRWTLREGILEKFRSLQLLQGKEHIASFHLDWVDLALFPQGTGFLILKVALGPHASPQPGPPVEIGLINDFLSSLRILQPFNVGWSVPTWNFADQYFQGRELVDYLLQEVSAQSRPGPARVMVHLDSYLPWASSPEGAPFSGQYTYSTFGQTYGAEFGVFTYVAFDHGIVAPALEANRQAGQPPVAAPADPFVNVAERAIYELATFTDLNDPDFAVHPDALDTWRRETCVRLWANWLGAFSSEHIVFAGFGNSKWTTKILPHNVQGDYYTLHLLALFQKINISFLFPEVAHRHDDLTSDLPEVRRLVSEFLKFQCRYWVTEATRKPQGKLLYSAFQKALGVDIVYRELRTGIEDMQRFYEGSYQRKINDILLVLALTGLPIGLFGTMFGTSVLAALPEAVWTTFSRFRPTWIGNGFKSEYANALAWLILLLLPGLIYGYHRQRRIGNRKYNKAGSTAP